MRFWSKYRKDKEKRSESASKAALIRWANRPPREPRLLTLRSGRAGLQQIIDLMGMKPETGYKFHPSKRWRFDFAWPSRQIAIKYEGIFSVGDCDEYNEAQKMGWTVFMLIAAQVESGAASELLVWIQTRLKPE